MLIPQLHSDMGIRSATFIPACVKSGFKLIRVIILEQQDKESKTEETPKNLPFWYVVLSVIQASFGVQSVNNRERDFKQGRLTTFIVAALLFTSIFVATLLLIVRWVLSTTGSASA